jgi:Tfp pilus assembly protein PilX
MTSVTSMTPMTRTNEKGVALVFTLFLMATLSALAVSLMFLSQTETASTRNYRTMSQARYGGEAGVHKAVNYFLNNYTPPTSFSSYNMTVSPVTYGGNPVILAGGVTGVTANYPDATVSAAFAAAVQGTLATNVAGTTTNGALGTVTYGASAKLLSMRKVTSYGGGTGVIQTWEITAVGTVPGALPATVEVSALLERPMVDAQTFAVFATGTQCASIDLGGTVETKSYDSGVAGSAASPDNYGGKVGTNGNMTIGGHVGVHGSLSSPRRGVGTCIDGSGVTALTTSGTATVDNNDVIELPQPLNFDTPALPSPMPPTSTMNTGGAICGAISLPATCTTVGSVTTIDPMGSTVVLGNVSNVDLVLKGGDYIINSFSTGNITLGTSTLGATDVVINIAGKTSGGTDLAEVWDMTAQDIVNNSMVASQLQLIYAGTGKFDLHGGAKEAFVLYAPNASVETHGNGNIYGSVLAKTVVSRGTPEFIYDRKLDNTAFSMGNYVMSSFSWKKY